MLCYYRLAIYVYMFPRQRALVVLTSDLSTPSKTSISHSKDCFPMAKVLFYSIEKMVQWCKEVVISLCVFFKMGGFEVCPLLFTLMKKSLIALLTCTLALGGATVGTITGAIKGQTTETGFLRGAGIGAVTGAITAVQLLELMVHGESFSKVALLFSLINGKVFMEWVTPAVQKAYEWQVSTPETSSSETSDIFEINGTRGLSQDSIKKLPIYKFVSIKTAKPCHEISCIICLEDMKNKDLIRKLPNCEHSFHLHCIDEWLTRHGSCPVCRKDLLMAP